MIALRRSSAPPPHRPDFIIIGAPKCGTSWLQRALAQHPNIVMVPDEIEYFSMHFDYSVEWYLNHFVRGLNIGGRLASATSRMIGEKSARYCSIAPDRIGLMHRLLPDARLILMTRDPVARHWSQAKRFFSKRRLHKKEGGILAMPREEVFAFLRPHALARRVLGDDRAAGPTSILPSQLLIVSQEKALAGPREAYDAVLTHIGVSRDYDPKAIKLLRRRDQSWPEARNAQGCG